MAPPFAQPQILCSFCRMDKLRVPAIGRCTHEIDSHVCEMHFRSAEACGFVPVRFGEIVPKQPPTEDEKKLRAERRESVRVKDEVGEPRLVNFGVQALRAMSQCHWRRLLTAAEVERLVRADGDCIKAGIPCEKHRDYIVPMEHDGEW